MGMRYTVNGSTADGEYLSEEMTLDYPDFRLIDIAFFDAGGNEVMPTAGDVSVFVDQGSGKYTSVQNGVFDADSVGEDWPSPQFSGGVARCKIVLSGVTDADTFRAVIYRGDVDAALPLRGSYNHTQRVAVDNAQTGFWENREYRFDLEVSAPIVVKFSSPINFILQFQSLNSHDGEATFTAYRAADGTPGGTFSPAGISNLPNNAMDNVPAYSKQITITSGGTFTPNGGAIAREFIKAVAATATAQQTTVGGGAVPERGLPPGDYYLMFTGTDASYRLVYEERP